MAWSASSSSLDRGAGGVRLTGGAVSTVSVTYVDAYGTLVGEKPASVGTNDIFYLRVKKDCYLEVTNGSIEWTEGQTDGTLEYGIMPDAPSGSMTVTTGKWPTLKVKDDANKDALMEQVPGDDYYCLGAVADGPCVAIFYRSRFGGDEYVTESSAQLIVKNGYKVSEVENGKVYFTYATLYGDDQVCHIYDLVPTEGADTVTVTIEPAAESSVVTVRAVNGASPYGDFGYIGIVPSNLGDSSGFEFAFPYGEVIREGLGLNYDIYFEIGAEPGLYNLTQTGGTVVSDPVGGVRDNGLAVLINPGAKELVVELHAKGSVKNGWKKENGKWHYYVDGMSEIGLFPVGKKWYFADENGVMQTGWIDLGEGNYYYAKSSGALAIGEWVKSGGKWYWMKSDGLMARNETVNIGGKEYMFTDGGVMRSGWISQDNGDYLYADGGAIVKSDWVKSKGKWYWMDEDGLMTRDTTLTLDGKQYMFADNGVMRTGWIKQGDSGDYLYAKSSGILQKKAWVKSGGKWYWIDEDGLMAHDTTLTLDGKEYMFAPNGVMQTGWIKQGDGGDYLYAKSSGILQKNKWVKSGGKWYWLKEDGLMARNEKLTFDGKDYWFKDNGVMATGWIKLNNGVDYYYAKSSGILQKNAWVKSGGEWYWMKEDGLMARNETVTIGDVDYDFDDAGVWVK